ncbi:MAG: multidrug ABC transporter ATP-binding protein [Thermobacillus sp. ZCTH02-B1]|uniref:ABC transporter ATP-binding protein n=1 Tax=Thermobacillus sp. ZCTH02-B1 TaxID=1858795 RepID=UPI000B555977|nr:ABC transporter ATP-binding protein [Thermobacillus sp. ZCTH02-B1]OUM96724.1 MAG: multidrug ABC transporter ATP-binding protein [Thermobacillus sp. ZCTH02-B1]
MDVFRQLKAYYWPHRALLFVSIGALVCVTALGLVQPYLMRVLIDDIIMAGEFELAPTLALAIVGVVIVKASMQFLHGFAGGRLGNRVAYNLRNALYRKLQYLPFQYYDTARTGDLMSRLTGDLDAIRHFVGFGFAQLLNMFLMVGFGGAMLLSIHWQLTLVTLVSMPLLAIVALRFERAVHPGFRDIRLAMSRMTTAVQENIAGVRTVKSFAREPYEIGKFTELNGSWRDKQLRVASLWGRYFPVMEVLANVCVVILLVYGGSLVIREDMTLGKLVQFFSMVWYIIGPLWGLGFHINNYTQSKASGERVLEILNQPVQVKDAEDAIELDPAAVQGRVQFRNVTFRYPDKAPAILDFNLDAKPGSVIGLLGGTGSGKSTVVQLLMRAYDVKQGEILLDGVDIRNIRLESLRSLIAAVFQETFLFSASIRDNIAYGAPECTMDDIVRAAKLAKAHDFIMELPQGYDTVVGERGLGLSGGQKQRIAIARALVRNPRILILDDATSAVDMETERKIQENLREAMAGRTTFIIAHRIASLRHADEILVLDQGRIVQRGTHDELIAVPGPYRDMYDIQYADRPDIDPVGAERRVAK